MDYKTLYLVMVSVFFIQALALMQSWLQNREEIGIRDWAMAAILMSAGSLLSAAAKTLETAALTDSLHLVGRLIRDMGGALGVAGWFYVWVGSLHFYRKPAPSYRAIAIFTLVFTAALTLRHLLGFTDSWRLAWVSGAIGVFAALTFKAFLQKRLLHNPTVLLVLAIVLVTSVVWFWRAVANLADLTSTHGPGIMDILSLYNGIVASVSFTVGMIVLTNERINERLTNLALKDPLTDVLNRRAFFDSAMPVLDEMRRGPTSIAVCVIDLDFFKTINDTYGHAAGDQLLKQFAECGQKVLRDGDVFARIGGEEFALLLPRARRHEVKDIVERLRRAVAEIGVVSEGDRIKTTFSAGIHCEQGPSDTSIDRLIELADLALYEAKQTGRNRFVFDDEITVLSESANRRLSEQS